MVIRLVQMFAEDEAKTALRVTNAQWESILVVSGKQCTNCHPMLFECDPLVPWATATNSYFASNMVITLEQMFAKMRPRRLSK